MTARADSVECRRHADALLEIVGGIDTGPSSTAALDHLEWCRPCSNELQDLALALVAFRRLDHVPRPGGEVGGAQADLAWERLRARILRGRAAAAGLAWRSRATLGGLATSALIVAAIVGPSALQFSWGGDAEPVGLSPAQAESFSREVEAHYIWQSAAGSLADPVTVGAGTPGPRQYPDGIQPERKEVPARPSVHTPKLD